VSKSIGFVPKSPIVGRGKFSRLASPRNSTLFTLNFLAMKLAALRIWLLQIESAT
jgi:hypothetical protein